MTDTRPKLPVLLYDGDCSLCVRFSQALGILPGTESITRISAREDWVYGHFPQLNKEDCLNELHLIDAEGNVLKGAATLTYLMEQFPGVKKFAWLIESNMGQKAVDFFHKVADHYRQELHTKRCGSCDKSNSGN